MCCNQKSSKITEVESCLSLLHYTECKKYTVLNPYLLLQSVRMSHISVGAAPLTISL